MEKRKFERAPLDQSVAVVDENWQTLLGEARDLSLGGAFIAGVSAPVGAKLVVHLRCPGEDEPMPFPCTVRWQRADGIGVQFGKLGARETHALSELIRTLAPSRTREKVASEADLDIPIDFDDAAEG